ncbi:trifunctional transcriptional regulator/proline dehydrogenase/L-glutamate gamma-semialdehyde dehydrogenase [Pigmentiphaga sp.]|uniref:trifunctional transcriptional regulator/proline dehydrogenase/L-glutamate gamma-semialdehyde dehydrogenase n=1 Tax=Pigmentiphaga sp. TaxID=1977564 RepID=UPI0025D7A755|nr:trifunctional transcriptional regulator/proline dehydrogenase/L-glutamate gamma-semialdehyde dehydrogenase [Pigmentiphaga sp.]MBX6317901.1 trifunctional transcriptional regulator/proline dehydrogenase/L-glutamate gamma-semialdehyde dehydrogenase [Pigmentiphaga sp.]
MMRTETSAQPFAALRSQVLEQSGARAAITADYRRAEPEMVQELLDEVGDLRATPSVQDLAHRLASRLRPSEETPAPAGIAQMLLQEFSLSSDEGVALMCLAESILRIPDAATRDALIQDKIRRGRWSAHLGHSPSLFVNAAAWGLLITGRVYEARHSSGLHAALARLIGKGGEPLLRAAVNGAMRLLGEQFVAGHTIEEALELAREREKRGYLHSYDMLGEAAVTEEDAYRYTRSYAQAIHRIGQQSQGGTPYDGPGISIKLSALHSRYARSQRGRVMDELYPRLLALARSACTYDMGLNIDAEEAARLDVSLDLLERLCTEPDLAGWNGLGFVVQAYQKRSLRLVEHLIALARAHGRRLMVRLVKGAYWDAEIKQAQLHGLDDYPVYTRKPHTDLAYLACARRLLAAPDAVFPQFATHNALTLASIYHLARPERFRPGQYEFQCLYGMGEALYDQVVAPSHRGGLERPCRIYAPVGPHHTLLAYLVRRLLENGANTSFVHRIANPGLPLDTVLEDPLDALHETDGGVGALHPGLPLPRHLYGPARLNSRGVDWSNEACLSALAHQLAGGPPGPFIAAPMQQGGVPHRTAREIRNPALATDLVGHVYEATPAEVDAALEGATHASRPWQDVSAAARAALLEGAADRIERDMADWMAVLVREAGKTLPAAAAEVRETVDFLRYYAAEARTALHGVPHRPWGVVACISPWNFPLSIFIGQIAAALVAGNAVVAKPAEQTPLIAARAVAELRKAGIPRGALQLLPGPGETVGAQLVSDPRVQAVLFTGSLEVAGRIRAKLAERLAEGGHAIAFVAETGGLNAMIVDSSALPEQVVADVMESAFDGAGQRCSALRLLCVQEDVADAVLAMLRGAMSEWRVGRPDRLDTDAGPVIDRNAREAIEAYIAAMQAAGHRVFRRCSMDASECQAGHFVVPTLIELDHPGQLAREVFGPVLHVVRYAAQALDTLLDEINAFGYGLTLGVHTRIDDTIERVVARARVGNIYVNRNMIGAVVGVQPFGGENRSGTGPKAGGPLYVPRLLASAPRDAGLRIFHEQPRAPAWLFPRLAENPALAALKGWAVQRGMPELAACCEAFEARAASLAAVRLPGPTGQLDVYALCPRETILCMADDESDRLCQLAAVLATGAFALWPSETRARSMHAALPAPVSGRIRLGDPASSRFEAALVHALGERLRSILLKLGESQNAVVPLVDLSPGEANIPLERLFVERAVSINTAAAGGDAGLLASA